MTSSSSPYQYLFGPVPSRRLGLSLGVDCVPHKVCSLDCVYCECGATNRHTLELAEYVPARAILDELARFMATGAKLDTITITGSGEPTLNPAIGEIITEIKRLYPQAQTALLTNSTMLHLPQVRARLLAFDKVLPSLDAVSEEVFARINRPAAGLSSRMVVEGLVSFSQEYRGRLWVEVLIVPGINDGSEEIALIKEVLTRINPERVQLNALDRPGTCAWVKPASAEQLLHIAHALLPLPVEIVSRAMLKHSSGQQPQASVDAIMAAIRRRPATVEDLAMVAGTTINVIEQLVESLLKSGQLATQTVDGHCFYRIP
jgi:wyosine [tRNA(Phe)-imidazoG37] synthetase (radical SAM superfamily)